MPENLETKIVNLEKTVGVLSESLSAVISNLVSYVELKNTLEEKLKEIEETQERLAKLQETAQRLEERIGSGDEINKKLNGFAEQVKTLETKATELGHLNGKAKEIDLLREMVHSTNKKISEQDRSKEIASIQKKLEELSQLKESVNETRKQASEEKIEQTIRHLLQRGTKAKLEQLDSLDGRMAKLEAQTGGMGPLEDRILLLENRLKTLEVAVTQTSERMEQLKPANIASQVKMELHKERISQMSDKETLSVVKKGAEQFKKSG